MHGQHRSVALADPGNFTNNLVRFEVEASDDLLVEGKTVGLVDKAKELDDWSVLRLRDELSKGTNVIESALSVGESHCT